MNQFEEDFKPFHFLIDFIFTDKIEDELESQFLKYKKSFLNNDSSRNDFDNLIKKYSAIIINHFSRNYKNKVLAKYFSDTGIVFLISSLVTIKSKNYYNELITLIKE